MTESWKPIPGYAGLYEVSDYGRVRSLEHVDSRGVTWPNRILKPTPTPKGYLHVSLRRSGKATSTLVHRLVAKAFIPNPDNLPQVNHIDGVPGNNHVSNLEWVTNAQNGLHAKRTLLIGVRPVFGIDIATGERVDFDSLKLASEAGHLHANIQKCIAGIRKQHHGFKWFDAAMSDEA